MSNNVTTGPVATLNFNATENIGISVNMQGGASSDKRWWVSSYWVSRAAVYNLTATGRDDHSGMHSITLGGGVVVTCIGPSGLAQQKQGDISQTTVAQAGSSPTTLSVNTRINMQDYIHECSSPYHYHSLDIQLTASATNAHGDTVTTPVLELRNDPGAASIRVITFNIGYDQDAFKHGDPTPLLQRYGRDLLSQADIVFLQEVKNSDFVKTLGDSSGLPYRYADGSRCVDGVDVFGDCVGGYQYTDVAILSRYPLVQTSYTFIDKTKLLDARVEIDDQSYRIMATHFKDGKDSSSIQERIDSANLILSRLQGETNPVILGGDFNNDTRSVIDPNNQSEEYLLLTRTGLLNDAYDYAYQNVLSGITPPIPVPFCSQDAPNARGLDWILYKGPYMVTDYQACLDSQPSDHACVLVSLGHWLSYSHGPLL